MKIGIIIHKEIIYFSDIIEYDCLQAVFSNLDEGLLYVGKYFENQDMGIVYEKFAKRMKLKRY